MPVGHQSCEEDRKCCPKGEIENLAFEYRKNRAKKANSGFWQNKE